VGITFFNWDELKVNSRGDLSAILCLAYAQTIGYNELSTKTLMKRLNLQHIPIHIFNKNMFQQHKYSLTCSYKTVDPQSYFKNSKFLISGASARYNAVYSHALSMPRISDTVNYIPREYYTKVTYNPFLHITEDKIYFPQESS